MRTCVVCSAAAKIYCENDKAFLCKDCDLSIHSCNALAAKHSRLPVCDLCFEEVATSYCKNDAAFLCDTCDHAVHCNNPLASRHEIVPVAAALEEKAGLGTSGVRLKAATNPEQSVAHSETGNVVLSEEVGCSFDDLHVVPSISEDLVGTQIIKPNESQAMFKDFDACELDNLWMDRLDMCFDIADIIGGSEAVVPSFKAESDLLSTGLEVPSPGIKLEADVPAKCIGLEMLPGMQHPSSVITYPSKPTVISGVAAADASDSRNRSCCGLTREQRVLRYREKRLKRRFEKTIRYASRKAYAEVRPRVKGRFVKRQNLEACEGTYATSIDELADEDHADDMSDVAVVPDFSMM